MELFWSFQFILFVTFSYQMRKIHLNNANNLVVGFLVCVLYVGGCKMYICEIILWWTYWWISMFCHYRIFSYMYPHYTFIISDLLYKLKSTYLHIFECIISFEILLTFFCMSNVTLILYLSFSICNFFFVGVQCEGGEWFHYSCVGLTPETRFKGKWFCPTCRNQQWILE